MLNFFSVQSARYEISKDRWKDVALEVYHDPAHGYNVERMTTAMKASLDYFNANFSPFQFKQVRIQEFPAYARFAQSFANTIPYSEAIGFIADYRDPEKIDMVTYVTAHEVGHQWWGHQVIGSDQQGATLLMESLAQYSALMVMEQMYGPEQIRKFLKYELDRYLRSRGTEVLEELPLVRVENQPYIHYQKGGLAMYMLKDQIGAERVNEALRGLLAEFAFKPAPYANSNDLMRHFRRVAGPEHEQLIADLFEKITLYDVKVTDAKSQRAHGRTLGCHARGRRAQAVCRWQRQGNGSAADRAVRRGPVYGGARSQGLRQEERDYASSAWTCAVASRPCTSSPTASRRWRVSIRSTSASTATRTTT